MSNYEKKYGLRVAMWGHPVECTGACSFGSCDCNGTWPIRAYANETVENALDFMEEQIEFAMDVVRRIRQWDHLDGAGDGEFWKRELDKVIDRDNFRKAWDKELTDE